MAILSLDWVMQVTGNLERDKSVEHNKSKNKKKLPKKWGAPRKPDK
jgi:hypothetical protein